MQNTQGKQGEGFSAAAVAAVAAAQTISWSILSPVALEESVCVVCIHVCGYVTCGTASCVTCVCVAL